MGLNYGVNLIIFNIWQAVIVKLYKIESYDLHLQSTTMCRTNTENLIQFGKTTEEEQFEKVTDTPTFFFIPTPNLSLSVLGV